MIIIEEILSFIFKQLLTVYTGSVLIYVYLFLTGRKTSFKEIIENNKLQSFYIGLLFWMFFTVLLKYLLTGKFN